MANATPALSHLMAALQQVGSCASLELTGSQNLGKAHIDCLQGCVAMIHAYFYQQSICTMEYNAHVFNIWCDAAFAYAC
jgi:hypothetical protein